MKRVLFFLFLMIQLNPLRAQQDAQFSQYVFNGLFINPAYAGYQERINIQSLYRYQWTGIKGAPRTATMAVDASLNNDQVGLALQVTSDKLGAQQNVMAFANYSYRMQLDDNNESKLAFGLGVGVLQARLNGDLLNPLDAGDPQIPYFLEGSTVPDARAGVFLSNQKYYIGLSADNMISGFLMKRKILNFNFIAPRPHYYLTAGFIQALSPGIQVKPFFLLKDDIGGPTSLDLNTFFLFYERFWIGAGYRTGIKLYPKKNLDNNIRGSNALVGMVEFYATKRIKIGYTYDQSSGSLKGISGGTHEISIGFGFSNYADNKFLRCYF